MTRFQLRDEEETRLELGPHDFGSTFVSVARSDDDEAEDRVFYLTRADAVALVGELTLWLATPPTPKEEP